jgi:hypothetical protein
MSHVSAGSKGDASKSPHRSLRDEHVASFLRAGLDFFDGAPLNLKETHRVEFVTTLPGTG